MNNRPAFSPPPAPDVATPAAPVIAQRTRSTGERLGWWIATTALVMLEAGWLWLWWQLLSTGAGWDLALFFGLPGAVCLAAGIGWFSLTIRQDFQDNALYTAAAWQEIEQRGAAIERTIRTNQAWSRHWQRDKPPVEQVIRMERDPAPVSRLARETWEAARVIDATPEPAAAPPWQPGALPDGRDTETLPALPDAPGPFDYYGTPGRPSAAWLIVDAALQDRPYGVRALGLTRTTHEKAMARLIAGEVMIAPQGRGLPPTLAYTIARTRQDPALAHQLVASLLGAPSPTVPGRARVTPDA